MFFWNLLSIYMYNYLIKHEFHIIFLKNNESIFLELFHKLIFPLDIFV